MNCRKVTPESEPENLRTSTVIKGQKRTDWEIWLCLPCFHRVRLSENRDRTPPGELCSHGISTQQNSFAK